MKAWIAPALLLVLVAASLLWGGTDLRQLDAAVLGLRGRRVLAAVAAGGALSVSGVAMQCLLRNPLADPFLLGMSGGASLGAVAVVVAFGAGMWVGPVAAVGAFGSAVLVAVLGRSGGSMMPATRLILAGVALASVFGALTTLILQLVPDDGVLRASLFWTSGSLGAAPTSWCVGCLILGIGAVLGLRRRAGWMDRLLLGHDTARSLGVPVARFRLVLLFGAALLTGASVALGGLIGFVGLLGPHFARLLWGPGHRRLVPQSAWIGAAVLLASDLLARTVAYPRELSVGVLTALLGGPLFLFLLRRRGYAFGGGL